MMAEATIWEHSTDYGSVSADAVLTVMSNETGGMDKDATFVYAEYYVCNSIEKEYTTNNFKLIKNIYNP
jgi:hypothetical protein